MSGELERLLIRLEADTSMLRRELNNADKQVSGFAAGVDRNLAKSSKSFGGLNSAIASSLKAFAGLAGAGYAIGKAFDAINAVGEVNDLARAAALGTDAFQELAFAANRAGIENEALAKGAQRFAVNMSELRAQTGGFNTFLKDHLPALQQQLMATSNQEQAYRVLADGVKALRSEEDRTALAMAAFGKAGGDLVEVLQNGAAGMSDAAKQARSYGAVLSSDVLNKGEEIKKQYADLKLRMEKFWQAGIVGAVSYAQEATKAAAAAGSFGAFNPTGAGGRGKQGTEPFGPPKPADPWAATVSPGEDQLLPKPDTSGLDALTNLSKQLAQARNDHKGTIEAEQQEELEKFQRMLDDKKITEEQFLIARAQINAIAGAKLTEQLTRDTEEYRQRYSEIEGVITNSISGALIGSFESGKFAAGEMFKEISTKLAALALEILVLKPLFAAIMGPAGGAVEGLLSSALGAAFGGGKAAGGPVIPSKSYLVGERGPELFVPSSGGHIMNNRATRGMMGGDGVVNNYTIDARGADISVAERIERALAMSDRSRREPVSAVGGHQRRHPYRSL